MPQPLTVTVSEVSTDHVIVKCPNGREFELPKHSIAGQPTAGQVLRVLAVTSSSDAVAEAAFARTLLNELLGR